MHIANRKTEIAGELERVRRKTLWLLSQVPVRFWNLRVHDFYSPIGWHFGHIGMTEEFWTCGRALGRAPQDAHLCFLYANIPENPKDNRVHLPSQNEVTAYLHATRLHVLQALEEADIGGQDALLADGYAWEFAIQHECQHQETIAELLQLIRQHESSQPSGNPHEERRPSDRAVTPMPTRETFMVCIPGGEFVMGSDDRHGYDNEKRAHVVAAAPFELDAHPVTAADWLNFMADGGYENRDLWSEPGWRWRAENGVTSPEYWLPSRSNYLYCSADRVRLMEPDEPVTSLSWYEADAYARWAGKRLPTEAEWEFAAAYDPMLRRTRRYPWGDSAAGAESADCELRRWQPSRVGHQAEPNALGLYGMGGGVWEWTASPFLPYAGFDAFPYDGYSKDHMDGTHFVCRGGSWATDRRILRASFRNWYVPTYRQGFLGMRCAR